MTVWRSAAASTVLVAVAAVMAPAAALAAPQSDPDERAAAIASPALVYLDGTITGYLRDKKTGTALQAAPIILDRPCTGFVVNPDGYAVTNGLCIQPSDATLRQSALYSYGRKLVAAKQLTADKLDGYVQSHMSTTTFTGLEPTATPDTQVTAQTNTAKGGGHDGGQAVAAQIVKVDAPDAGNVALVQLSRKGLPALELSPSTSVAEGTHALVLGYNTDDADPRTGTYTVQSKGVQVTGEASRGTVTQIQVSDDVGIYSRGGPVIDADGRVLGVLDNDESLASKAVRAATPVSAITALLGEAGVSSRLGDSDRLYRDGLDAYFAGRYATAARDLGTVVGNQPTNLVAARYRDTAAQKQPAHSGGGGGSSGLEVLVPVILVTIAGGAAAVLVVRSNKRQRA